MRARSGSDFLRLLLAFGDAPVGDAAVEILPELLAEFWLLAVELKDRRVGLEVAHHPRVGRVGNATFARPGAESVDPLVERPAPLRLRLRHPGHRHGSRHDRQACSPGQESLCPFAHGAASRCRFGWMRGNSTAFSVGFAATGTGVSGAGVAVTGGSRRGRARPRAVPGRGPGSAVRRRPPASCTD